MDPQVDANHGALLQPSPTQRRNALSRRAKLLGAVIALVVLAALGWLAWYLTHPDASAGGGAGGAGGRRGTPASTVGIASAERADIPVLLNALGTVTPAANVTVRAQVSGVLQQVSFREGDMVRAGQVLANIDPRQFEMALLQSTGQRQRDEAQLESAKVTLQRYRTLLEQDSIARQDVDTQAALVKQLEGTVVTDRAAEGTARLNLGYCRIVAPISGRIGLRAVDIGNVVSTGDTNGIATITQVAPIDVVFSLPQDQIPDIHARAAQSTALPVTALDRNRTDTLDTGRFSTLDNQVDTQTGTVRAKARFANAKLNLFPNQFVNVQLLLRTIQNAIVVPVTGLRHAASGDFVYVLNEAERTVSLRTVTRGQATVDKVEIVSGLQAGEKVITEGGDRLKDGAKVMLAGDKPTFGGGKGAGGKGRRKRDGAGADAAGGASPNANPTVNPTAAMPSSAASSDTPRPARPIANGTAQAQANDTPRAPVTDQGTAPAAAPVSAAAGPTAAQRQRMLDQVKDDPDALARRKAFLDKIDKGDPDALERWQRMQERRREGGQAPAQ